MNVRDLVTDQNYLIFTLKSTLWTKSQNLKYD